MQHEDPVSDAISLEQRLAAAPYVREAVVVRRGDRLVAVVVADAAALLEKERVDLHGILRVSVHHAALHLPEKERPETYRILPGPLPRNGEGRPDPERIRSLLDEGRGWGPETLHRRDRGVEGSGGENGGDRAASAVGAALASVLSAGAPEPRPELSLGVELGLDSLDRLELVARIESALGIALGDEAVRALRLEDLLAEVRRTLSSDGKGPARGESLLAALGEKEDAELEKVVSTAKRLWSLRPLAALFLRTLFGSFCRIEIRGLANVPTRGPFLLCPNHQSFVDGLFIVPFLPRPTRDRLWLLVTDYVYKNAFLRDFLYMNQGIPIDNQGDFLPALRLSAHVLREGGGLLVFPEGIRSVDGSVGPWRPGPGLLVQEVPAPIVPVALSGPHRVMPVGSKGLSFRDAAGRRRVRVTFGKPVLPGAPPPGEDAATTAWRTMQRVRAEVLHMLADYPPDIAVGACPD
jgi:long-chain acyl-CoA synthetase